MSGDSGSWQPVRLERRRASAATEAAPGGLSVGLVSLGCPKNLVDSEVMLGQLASRGHTLVADARDADVIVVNTCSFIEGAKRESIDTILELAELKKEGRAQRLIGTGCLAQRYDTEIRREIPEIDATLGTGQVQEIVRAVEGERTHTDAEEGPPTWVYDHTAPRVLATPPHLAYLKISEGCDYTCSFCIIPTLRGKHRSRREDDIVAEAEALALRGVRELVLVAQDSTRYGLDLGRRDGLAPLLRRLGRVDRVHWIRVLYAYPATLSPTILEAMAEVPRVVEYVDIPLQHASDRVLESMKRPTGRRHLMGIVERIREHLPAAAIRTSFIVGFPGETERDFEELIDFVGEAQFDNVGVFNYSDEEGTAAFGRATIDRAEMEARRAALLEAQQSISQRRNERHVGRQLDVLIDGEHPESELLLAGRWAGQAPEIDGRVIIGDGTAEAGDLLRCEVLEAHPYDLVARIVGRSGTAPGQATLRVARVPLRGRPR